MAIHSPPLRSPSTSLVVVAVSQLKVGVRLRAPIYDDRGDKSQLLLAAGSELTAGQLEAVAARGVSRVRVHPHEVAWITKHASASAALSSQQRAALRQVAQSDAETAAHKPAPAAWACSRDSFCHEVQRPQWPERNPQTASQFENSYREQAATAKALFTEFIQSGNVNPHQVEDLVEEQLHELAADSDEFLSRGLQPVSTDYPSRHGLQTAMLASAIGATMGLREDDLVELGFGCLLHDGGMLLVPKRLHQCDEPLSTSDRLAVQKHPMYAADRLSRCPNVSHAAKMVVYQMHERMDGSGYPRQRQGCQIHAFARIAAVADTYLALVSPHSSRPGLEPYQAVEKLLFATRKGLFDPSAVRALLHAVSLFPIGSQVQLSDGRIGRVIRGNREHFARPVVEVVHLTGPQPRVETIDLMLMPEFSIVATADESDNSAAGGIG